MNLKNLVLFYIPMTVFLAIVWYVDGQKIEFFHQKNQDQLKIGLMFLNQITENSSSENVLNEIRTALVQIKTPGIFYFAFNDRNEPIYSTEKENIISRDKMDLMTQEVNKFRNKLRDWEIESSESFLINYNKKNKILFIATEDFEVNKNFYFQIRLRFFLLILFSIWIFIATSKINQLGPAKEFLWNFRINKFRKDSEKRKEIITNSLTEKEQEDYKRLKSEVAIVNFIQESLFPPNYVRCSGMEIACLRGKASEATGDWWYYKTNDDFNYIIIIDATGHGVPAAMAVLSASTYLSSLPWSLNPAPSEIVKGLNGAIFETMRAKVSLTGIVLQMNKKSKEFIFCNASHEFPTLINNEGVSPLIPNKLSPKIGDKQDSEYFEDKLVCQEDDIFAFHTDGIFEFSGARGRAFKERDYMKLLRENYTKDLRLDECMDNLKNQILKRVSLKILPDDTTLLSIRVKNV